MKVAAIIPARYGSTRFEGKPLAVIQGKPMIEWVYRRACSFKSLAEVVVATDDQRILNTVEGFGGKAIMTGAHATGTERCAEAARAITADFIINIQGDEPAIAEEHVTCAVDLLVNGSAEIATLYHNCAEDDDFANPNIVKLVTANDGKCLYFSRATIPFQRGNVKKAMPFKRHIGVYGFRKDVLLKVSELPGCAIEEAEMLEQLRWLYYGYEIYAGAVTGITQAVDVAADIEKLPDLRF